MKKIGDNKYFVGTVLMDLSKVSHDLLAVKLHAYDLSEDALTFVHSCLNHGKQGAKINDTESAFHILLSGIPQGSILGPIFIQYPYK